MELDALEDRTFLSAGVAAAAGFRLWPCHDFFGTAGAAPAGLGPAQVRKAYGFDAIRFDGRGQTIAIVDAFNDPNIAGDLATFDRTFGIADPPSFRVVGQDGSSTLPVGTNPGWATETALDVEWAHALAPAANILLVEAEDNFVSSLITAIDSARHAAGVSVVSMSFGGGEADYVLGLDGYFTTPAGHAGVTFLAASGDGGAPGIYPSLSPNVVSVGGTTLSLDAAGNYANESGWSGSGGGISALEPQPPYQKGVVTQSTTQRTIPDVALDADPATGVAVYDSFGFPGNSWIQVGGTSFSAPAWAALIGVADQARAEQGLPSMDGPSQTLPGLYGLPARDFHDIVTGNNGWPAGPGYDLVTGRGTPVVPSLIADLVPGSLTSVSISGPSSAAVGQPYALTLKSQFGGSLQSWTIDWGDGAVDRVAGNPTSATHAYATGGRSFTIHGTATDGTRTYDGGTVQVSVTSARPDLTAAFMTTPPAKAKTGQTLQTTVRVRNQGTARAWGTTGVSLFLSPVRGVTAAASLVATVRPRFRLAVGAFADVTIAFRVPRRLAAGRYYLVAVVNGSQEIVEDVVLNNIAATRAAISITGR